MQNTLINSINQKIKPHLYESVGCGQITRLPKALLIPKEVACLDKTLKTRINSKSVVRVSHISKNGLLLNGASVLDNVLPCNWNEIHSDVVDYAANAIADMY